MDALSLIEQDKYRRMWEVPGYRVHSPAQRVADEVLEKLGTKPGETIIDYGCGAGAAMPAFRARGLVAMGVDLVRAPSDERFPLVIASLWDLPSILGPSDWCFCVDVLEHLPPEKVDAALAGIAARTTRGGFLQPALMDEGFGRYIGEVLHLTVREPEYWRAVIGEHFDIESSAITDDRLRLAVYVRKRG